MNDAPKLVEYPVQFACMMVQSYDIYINLSLSLPLSLSIYISYVCYTVHTITYTYCNIQSHCWMSRVLSACHSYVLRVASSHCRNISMCTVSTEEVYVVTLARLFCSACITGWWFQTFLIFHDIWDNPSHWPIFFNMVKTTNQIRCCVFYFCQGEAATTIANEISWFLRSRSQALRLSPWSNACAAILLYHAVPVFFSIHKHAQATISMVLLLTSSDHVWPDVQQHVSICLEVYGIETTAWSTKVASQCLQAEQKLPKSIGVHTRGTRTGDENQGQRPPLTVRVQGQACARMSKLNALVALEIRCTQLITLRSIYIDAGRCMLTTRI